MKALELRLIAKIIDTRPDTTVYLIISLKLSCFSSSVNIEKTIPRKNIVDKNGPIMANDILLIITSELTNVESE
jgi:hypothetical protein